MSLTYCSEKKIDKKNVDEKDCEKPILQVIAQGKIKDSAKECEVTLENVKEKRLDKPLDQPRMISSESIRKLREKIIGKAENDQAKGNNVQFNFLYNFFTFHFVYVFLTL